MKKTFIRNESFKLLFFCALLFFAYTSLAGQEKTSSNADLTEFDFGIQELETNYVGFPTLVTEQTRNQYEALKARCRQQVDKQERKPWEALGELYAWFGDFHLRVGIYSQPYMRKVPTYEEMKKYNPTKTFRKVTDRTFLIRFPSCMGDDPTLEWVHQSIDAYLASGCENLIIDIRGNGGGTDEIFNSYEKLLYDRKGYVDGVEIRNTPAHIAEMAEIELDWLQQVVETMKKSQDEFVAMTPRQVELVYDTIFPLPHQAATDYRRPSSQCR